MDIVDHFAKFGVPRRPWLDVDQIKQRFHELSIDIHPDRSLSDDVDIKKLHHKEFASVNSAFQCLSDTKSRVRHLLELERGCVSENVQPVPSEMTDWFTEIGLVCRKVDLFLEKKEKQDSPILQANLMGEGIFLNDEISGIHQKLQVELMKINEALKLLNPQWDQVGEDSVDRIDKLPLAELGAIAQRLSFWAKWSAQLGERSSRLMF